MPSLAELQYSMARAITTVERNGSSAELVGGSDPARRLDIHLRHYEASLTTVVRDKFPACAWLAGVDLVSAAARSYVKAHPPRQPCIAEYGEDFPRFLANFGRAQSVPYLESFAMLEWAVGQVSIAIDYPSISWPDFVRIGSQRLIDATLRLQPGLRYLRSAWGVDLLMAVYLQGADPARFELPESDTFIEVRGARGAVHIAPLNGAAFEFRTQLAAGRSIGAAADRALEHTSSFDPGAALQQLANAGLAVEAQSPRPANAS